MNTILFDDERQNLLPFTFTRPVALIRVGILTIREKWELLLAEKCSVQTEKYLSKKYPSVLSNANLYVNGSLLPDSGLISEIKKLAPGSRLIKSGTVLAVVAEGTEERNGKSLLEGNYKDVDYEGPVQQIKNTWDIFSMNGKAIAFDYNIVTRGKKSGTLSKTNQVIAAENIFLDEGARVECAMLNASAGPIYIGRNAEVMEGAMVRGPFALGEHSTVKMGAKIYGDTTFGPYCKVGGEITNSVIFGCSNKAHDGFLGNSVIGEWCNIGADSNNSNLKNNYSIVKTWNYKEEDFISTGLQFCGLMMGDHSKCSINTMFNTGTVVGVSANIFGTGFPPKLIPSFSWGGSDGFSNYRLQEAMEVAQRVYERRKLQFDMSDQEIFKHLFQESTKHRAW